MLPAGFKAPRTHKNILYVFSRANNLHIPNINIGKLYIYWKSCYKAKVFVSAFTGSEP